MGVANKLAGVTAAANTPSGVMEAENIPVQCFHQGNLASQVTAAGNIAAQVMEAENIFARVATADDIVARKMRTILSSEAELVDDIPAQKMRTSLFWGYGWARVPGEDGILVLGMRRGNIFSGNGLVRGTTAIWVPDTLVRVPYAYLLPPWQVSTLPLNNNSPSRSSVEQHQSNAPKLANVAHRRSR